MNGCSIKKKWKRMHERMEAHALINGSACVKHWKRMHLSKNPHEMRLKIEGKKWNKKTLPKKLRQSLKNQNYLLQATF